MVVLNKSSGTVTDFKGILLLFVAVFAAVGYTLVARKLVEDYNPITITAYQSFYGLIMFLPLFLFRELPLPDAGLHFKCQPVGCALPWCIRLGICFILLTLAIRELGAAKANIFANIVPVVTAFVSFMMLKEPMPLIKIAGILVAIAGTSSDPGRDHLLEDARQRKAVSVIPHIPDSYGKCVFHRSGRGTGPFIPVGGPERVS